MLSFGWLFIGMLFYLVIHYSLTLGYEKGRNEERENWEDWLRSEFDAKRLFYFPRGMEERVFSRLQPL
jgi:hypothetical protein